MTTEPEKWASSARGTTKRWLLGGAVILGFLVVALVGLNLYRNRNSLTADRLAAARKQWESAGIRDYDIQVQVTGRTGGVYFVEVRSERLKSATMNGTPGENMKWAEYWTVAGLFDVLEDELRRTNNPSAPKCHTEIEFDSRLGYPLRFVRSSQGQNTVVEISLAVK